jgi:N-acetylglucosaminyldiphosphoundecaprenol N-acetyl-beta-D-mannosaminyltransferase
MSLPEPFYFLGIRFWNQSTEALLQLMDQTGGLLTVPAAPALAQTVEDPLLKLAYQSSDWAVMDGGFAALVLRLVFFKKIRRISGLQILMRLTGDAAQRPVPLEERSVLWVVPDAAEEKRTAEFLAGQGFAAGRQSFYHAPFYGKDEDFEDRVLVDKILRLQPDWIVLCIGGGRQEKLGMRLIPHLHQLARRPVILCTGGAIAFLNGGQAKIPTWADRLYLGWFLRTLKSPKTFIPRYWKAAWQLPKLLWVCRGELFIKPPGNP